MSGHGPDAETYERASTAELKPQYLDNTLAFMFETQLCFAPRDSPWKAAFCSTVLRVLAGVETPLPAMTEALRTLLAGAIDYAGLFPPAALDMPEAARNYATYRAARTPGRWDASSCPLPG